MHFPIESGLISTTFATADSVFAELTTPVSGKAESQVPSLAQASRLRDTSIDSHTWSHRQWSVQGSGGKGHSTVPDGGKQAQQVDLASYLLQRLVVLGLATENLQAAVNLTEHQTGCSAQQQAELGVLLARYEPADLQRLAAALDVLEEEPDVSSWEVLRMAVILGDKLSFDAMLTLAELQIIHLDAITPDGSSLLHTIAWHAVEDPLLMDMPFMLEPMPARDRFADMPEEYLQLRDRIGAMSRAGADMDSSIDRLRMRSIAQRSGQATLQAHACLQTAQSGIQTNQNPAQLGRGPQPSPQDVLEITWNTLRQHASPLVCALFDMQRDASRLVVVQGLLEHGAHPDLPFREPALAAWRAFHDLPAMPCLPVHMAACNLPCEVMLAFIAAGADLMARGSRSETVLHWAALNHEYPEVMELLLATAAAGLLDIQDCDRKTPLMLARKVANNHRIIQALCRAAENLA